MGMVPVIATPQQAADFVARETAKWSKVIKEANIQLQ
jgi:tripartite-type tricarboxylate transporter receptor subunit TctC